MEEIQICIQKKKKKKKKLCRKYSFSLYFISWSYLNAENVLFSFKLWTQSWNLEQGERQKTTTKNSLHIFFIDIFFGTHPTSY